MSSSPTSAAVDQPARTEQLLDLLADMPDPRDPRGIRYPLTGVLAVAVSAVLAGARSFAAIGEWAGDLSGRALGMLGVESLPEESTLQKLFARLDADQLDRQVGAFVWTRTRHCGGRRVIALDGKTVRGAQTRDTGPSLCSPVGRIDLSVLTVCGGG